MRSQGTVVSAQHPVTLVLMENGPTSMTGHHELSSSGRNFNEPAEAIPVCRVLERHEALRAARQMLRDGGTLVWYDAV